MTCNRCEDIHNAQKEGKTQNPCKCECHNSYTTGSYWLYDDITGTSTATQTINDCNTLRFTNH